MTNWLPIVVFFGWFAVFVVLALVAAGMQWSGEQSAEISRD
jgi:hypothetical protein